MSTVETQHADLLTQIRLLTESNNRRLATEKETLDQLKEIRDVVVGSANQRGLIHRMEDTEKFQGGLKKYAWLFVIAIVGGEPLVDRMIPKAQTIVQNPQSDAVVSLLKELLEQGETPTP